MTRCSSPIVLVVAFAGLLASGIVAHSEPPKSIRVGYSISLTGPNAAGAGITVLPNYRLWVKEVNAAGGILLKSVGKRVPIEVIEYDDHSNVIDAETAIERLISQDKVDFILAPWGTGLNLAVGPLFHRAGYPQLATTAWPPESSRLWPNSFWFLGTPAGAARAFVDIISKLRSEGKIGNTVAMLSVADQFGIGLAKVARKAFKQADFDLVYDRAYPVETRDMSEVLTEVKALKPDTFAAFSYPPDTIMITEQARVSDFNPKVFYTAVGTAFPLYKQRFGANVEGVMGIGGWNAEAPASKDYFKRHLEMTGQEPDRWASPITYASLQMLQRAIERVGGIDRVAVIKELQTGTFETVVGPVKFKNNLYEDTWWVGQWQNAEFEGIAPASLPGAQPIIFPKPPWHTDADR
ncbi:MAG: amino acid ABC transporter substrate-binding protein [Xanthobacteraceae bacterium]|jgi:branched-chain amino acid transport system substrate-binding protein